MDLPAGFERIEGAKELWNWFGYWPDFHDAEVICIHLNREGTSSLRIHTWERADEVDKDGYFVTAKHMVVEFLMEGITELNLTGFSGQNVIRELAIERVGSGYRVSLDHCYGCGGVIEPSQISIRLTPRKPKEA